jgi:hypothetical protein
MNRRWILGVGLLLLAGMVAAYSQFDLVALLKKLHGY